MRWRSGELPGSGVGAVSIHDAISLFDEFIQRLAVMHIGGSDDGFEDELVLDIDFHMVFVAVVRLVVLLRPACVEVFVRLDLRVVLQCGRHFARFDPGVVCPAVALPGLFGKARVNHHALLRQGQSVFLLQMREEGVEQALEGLRPDEQFAEVADRLSVGHRVPGHQAEEGAEAGAVGDLKARGVVGQTVEAL